MSKNNYHSDSIGNNYVTYEFSGCSKLSDIDIVVKIDGEVKIFLMQNLYKRRL